MNGVRGDWCATKGVALYLGKDSCCIDEGHDYHKRQHETNKSEECVFAIAWVGKLLRKEREDYE